MRADAGRAAGGRGFPSANGSPARASFLLRGPRAARLWVLALLFLELDRRVDAHRERALTALEARRANLVHHLRARQHRNRTAAARRLQRERDQPVVARAEAGRDALRALLEGG